MVFRGAHGGVGQLKNTMLLTKILFTLRRMAQRSPMPALDTLLSREQFDRVVERERARSDRSGEVFSLVLFAVGGEPGGLEVLGHLARILQRRLRLTDDAGRWDARRIAVLLPATPAAGAWTVIDDVCVCIPAGLPLPDCTVYCYPTEAPLDHGVRRDGDAERDGDPRPHQAMELLCAKRLPLWKRVIDIAGATSGLMLLAPLLAVVSLAVKLTSSGPVFFRQKRSGLGGRPFTIYKFRTMVVDAEARKRQLLSMNEQDGPAFKIKCDPRVTRLGRFLRKTSIDELPQLWNVLQGDMSLVGPRPLPCEESEACQGWLRRRLDVTPGLTCIWQVRGRSAVSFAEWVRMDAQYIRSRSLWTDVKLLWLTIPAVLFRRGAS